MHSRGFGNNMSCIIISKYSKRQPVCLILHVNFVFVLQLQWLFYTRFIIISSRSSVRLPGRLGDDQFWASERRLLRLPRRLGRTGQACVHERLDRLPESRLHCSIRAGESSLQRRHLRLMRRLGRLPIGRRVWEQVRGSPEEEKAPELRELDLNKRRSSSISTPRWRKASRTSSPNLRQRRLPGPTRQTWISHAKWDILVVFLNILK